MEQLVNIGAIVVDPALQPRERMDAAMVMEYAGEMQGGAQFPAVTAFGTVEECWLADGFHRIEAAKMGNIAIFKVHLLPGGRREAQLFSLGANATHGLRRTNADKRRAVETALRDAEWTVWSDREIASRCMVSAPLVAQVRMELGLVREERKVERGGVVYTMQTAGIGREEEQDLQNDRIEDTEETDGVLQEDQAGIPQICGTAADADRVGSAGDEWDFEQAGEESVEFGEEYVDQARAEAIAVSATTGNASRGLVAEGTQGEVGSEQEDTGSPTLPAPSQRLTMNQAMLPAPARSVPVLVPPAQAIPAPKLPAPATVVVLEARIIGETAMVTMGESGQAPRVMRHANKDALVEVLGQVVAAYFTV